MSFRVASNMAYVNWTTLKNCEMGLPLYKIPLLVGFPNEPSYQDIQQVTHCLLVSKAAAISDQFNLAIERLATQSMTPRAFLPTLEFVASVKVPVERFNSIQRLSPCEEFNRVIEKVQDQYNLMVMHELDSELHPLNEDKQDSKLITLHCHGIRALEISIMEKVLSNLKFKGDWKKVPYFENQLEKAKINYKVVKGSLNKEFKQWDTSFLPNDRDLRQTAINIDVRGDIGREWKLFVDTHLQKNREEVGVLDILSSLVDNNPSLKKPEKVLYFS